MLPVTGLVDGFTRVAAQSFLEDLGPGTMFDLPQLLNHVEQLLGQGYHDLLRSHQTLPGA